MSNIAISNLGVTFADGTVGLENINLTVPSGEFIALVGPSGSGKTTLLRTIAGFIEPTAGTIELDGQDVSHVPPEKRHMGMVFQQHAVWPHMTVGENVAYPLRRAGIPRAEAQQLVETTLATVGLDGFARRKPATLSGGQRQRVALARAIVASPKLLLLDEALSALDEPLRDALRRELVALTRTNHLTTVHVTHDRKEAIAIADRIAVLRDGRLEQFDTPDAVVTRPATAWVASFMADATILEGVVRAGQVVCEKPQLSWLLDDANVTTHPATNTGIGTGADALADGAVTVAVLPADVRVGPVGSETTGGAGTVGNAVITSVLFEVTGYSVTLDADGVEFRARMGLNPRPEVGDQVSMNVERIFVF